MRTVLLVLTRVETVTLGVTLVALEDAAAVGALVMILRAVTCEGDISKTDGWLGGGATAR